jgi:hypothetical protein
MSDDQGPRILRLLRCATHGDRRWKGHVMCGACGRIYQTESTYLPRAAPRVCACGKQLMPDGPKGDKLGMVAQDSSGGVVSAFIPAGGGLAEGPKLNTYDEQSWTARPICYLCYRLVAKNHKGRVPNWVSKEQLS